MGNYDAELELLKTINTERELLAARCSALKARIELEMRELDNLAGDSTSDLADAMARADGKINRWRDGEWKYANSHNFSEIMSGKASDEETRKHAEEAWEEFRAAVRDELEKEIDRLRGEPGSE